MVLGTFLTLPFYRLKKDLCLVDDMSSNYSVTNCPTKDHLLRDLKFLYDSLLDPKTMVCDRTIRICENARSSASKLLDCKQFVKDYKPEKIALINPFAVRLICEVELIDHPKDYTAPPPELILLPSNATLADIKTEATKAFQEVYVMFKRFEVEEVFGLGDLPSHVGSMLSRINSFDSSNSSITVRGKCHGKLVHRFRMERGLDEWTVNCVCGATDDDGERMFACDECGVWHHTRCAGIHDSDVVPDQLICIRCKRESIL